MSTFKSRFYRIAIVPGIASLLTLAVCLLTVMGVSLQAQTAAYPSAIATRKNVPNARNRVTTTLLNSMTISDTAFTIANANNVVPNMLLSLGQGGEIVFVCGVAGNVISVGYSSCPNIDGRGYDSTVKAGYVAGTVVQANITAWHYNALAAEVLAIENTLGVNLGNVSSGTASVPIAAGPTSLVTVNTGVTPNEIDIDTSLVPYLAGSQTFTGKPKFGGNFTFSGTVTNDSGLANLDCKFEMADNTTFNTKCRGSDGTVRLMSTGGGGTSIVYPALGVPTSTGAAWGASLTVGTGPNNLVQLNGSSQLPAVSAALLTNFPTLNQNTTGTAASITGLLLRSNTPLTTKGDIFVTDGVNLGRLPVGSNGQAIVADSTTTYGVKFGDVGTVTVDAAGTLNDTSIATGAALQKVRTPSASATLDSSGNMSIPGSMTEGAGSGLAGCKQYMGTDGVTHTDICAFNAGTGLYTNGPFSFTTNYFSQTWTAGSTGTTLRTLVSLNSSSRMVTTATTGTDAVGVALATATNGNSVEIAVKGRVACLADNATTVGNIAIVGTGTAGYCRDAGTATIGSVPLGTQVIGRMLTAVSGGAAVSVELFGPGHYGTLASVSGSLAGQVATTGVTTPTAISANQNNYSPAGLSSTSILRLTTDNTGVKNITGIAAQPDGTSIWLYNIGATDALTLVNASGSSTAANRFCFDSGANLSIRPGAGAFIHYDLTATCWRSTNGVVNLTSQAVGSLQKSQTPLTTKGDLWVTDGTNMNRLGVGTDGFALIADAASTNGVKWSAAGSGDTSTTVSSTTDNTLVVMNGTSGKSLKPATGTGFVQLSSGVHSVRTNPEVWANNLPTPALCDGSTDDSAAFNSAVAGTTVKIPGGATCMVTNLTLANRVTLSGGAGSILKKVAGSTTTYMGNITGTDITIENLKLDGASVVKGSGNLYYWFISGATNFVMKNCQMINTGSPSNTMGGILIYSSTATINGVRMTDGTVTGTQIKVDMPSSTKHVQISNNVLVGSAANGIVVTNSAGGYAPLNSKMSVEVFGNYISSVTDGFAGTGQTGNCGIIYQADTVNWHDNYCVSPRFSGVRINSGFANIVKDNHVIGAGETSMYAELGAAGNLFQGNVIQDCVSGINASNVSIGGTNRVTYGYDTPNTITGNRISNCTDYGISVEHDFAFNNDLDGVAFGIAIGYGNTSHDNRVFGNSITRNNTNYPKPACGICADKSINTGTDWVGQNTFSGGTVTPVVFPVSRPDGAVISAITKANPMVVTFSNSPAVAPAINQVWHFGAVAGMTEINGQDCTITAVAGSTFTCGAIDSTSYGTFTLPSGGPSAHAFLLYSSGTTPQYTLSSNLRWDDKLKFTGTEGSTVNFGSGGTVVYTSQPYGFTIGFGNGGSWSPAQATTTYFGHLGIAGVATTGGTRRVYISKTATLKQIYGACQYGNSPTTETGALSFRLNNTTDVSINASYAITSGTFSATGLSQAVTAGDYFEIKYVTPTTWATAPTSVICTGSAYFE